jgi:hypothetical protein
VDADSQETARAVLLAHIAASQSGRRASRDWPGRWRLVGRLRADIVAFAIAILVVVVVGAVFLGVGGERTEHVGSRHGGPPVIRNFSPGGPPALFGQIVCNAELMRPGVPPGSRGSPTGRFQANAGEVNGVNKYPFSITATGLEPTTGGEVYGVWLLPAMRTIVGTYQLLEPHRPQLLGVIEPGVARDGRLAAQGLVPPAELGTYLLVITLQSQASLAAPGRTVLEGYVVL